MDAAAKLAGYFTAHAIWCVSDGETLIPLLGFETADGTRQMHRFMTEKFEQGVQEGKDRLASNSDGAVRSVLVYDGYITLGTRKLDALFADIRDYGFPSRSLLMAIPYRPASSPEGLAVHRPKFLSFTGPELDHQKIGEAFFQGVHSHAKATPIWTKHLDESL